MSYLYPLIGLIEFTLAVLLWHRATPALRREAKWRAWEVWALGAALAFFAIGQFEAWWAWRAIPGLRLFGDLLLILSGAGRYWHIMRHRPPPHWSDLV